ncbi:MAG TPA: aldo/keto reductase [Terracidiphilus sp.]|jgi:pyridoxine 4-dehydrogenase|nr:aldo/keto reductase [Terracidiphilus sp.]
MTEATQSLKTFRVGKDMEVNRLGFGAMRITGEGIWGEPRDREAAKALVRRAVDLGVNFIDTADAYGPAVSEPIIGEALAPYAQGVVVATKGGLVRTGPNQWRPLGRPEYLTQQVELSLRWLKVDRIDLWQLHRIDPNVPVEESLGAIKRLQEAGKIRHIGLSEVSVAEIERARKVVDVVSVQNEYNVITRKSEDVVNYCEAHNLGFIPWFPVAAGRLTQPGSKLDSIAKKHNATVAQVSIAWLLHRSPVMLPIPGTSSIEHLIENMKSQNLTLSDDEFTALNAIA